MLPINICIYMYIFILSIFQTSDGSRSTAMDIDLGVPFGSTNKRLRMNGPSQGADRNGQLTDDNIIGSSHRGTLKNIEIFLSNPYWVFMLL